MKKTLFLLALALTFAGCTSKVQTSTQTESAVDTAIEAPQTTEDSQAGMKVDAQVDADVTVDAPQLQNSDDTTSLSTDLNATGIVEENFQ